MHDVFRRRLLRKLETLPEEQLYRVLDYIEFLESKFAPDRPPAVGSFQRFAERLEDRMRARALSPRLMSGIMSAVGLAGRVLEEAVETGRAVLGGGDDAETRGHGDAVPPRPPIPVPPRPSSTPDQEANTG